MQAKNDKTPQKCFTLRGVVPDRPVWLAVHPFRQSGILKSMSVPLGAPEQVYAQLRTAIIHRRPIAAFYRERRRLLCPHLLGWNKHRRLQVLCYQYGGDSESGLMPAGASDNWRCLAVENLSQLELLDGPWRTAENHSRPQTCIEGVELDVDDYTETAPPTTSPPQKVQNSSLAGCEKSSETSAPQPLLRWN